MPIYEYECKNCEINIEIYAKVEDADMKRYCENCGFPMKKVLSLTSIHVFNPQVVSATLTNGDGEDVNPYVRNKQELTDAINKYNDTERASKTGKVAVL